MYKEGVTISNKNEKKGKPNNKKNENMTLKEKHDEENYPFSSTPL